MRNANPRWLTAATLKKQITISATGYSYRANWTKLCTMIQKAILNTADAE